MIIHGDSLIELAKLPENSVDAVVTDPPYGLKFMNKHWDYDVPTIELWREVLRVLKPGAHLLSFGGTRTYHRMVCAIEDAGFEIRDQVQWIYGSGFPKSLNVGKQIKEFEGWGTALKPANEPIVLARKPLSESTVAKNVEKWGTGAINVDASRIGISANDPNHRKPSVPFTGRYFDVADGKSNGRPTENLNTQGRWPANVLFDESAAEMLDEQSGDRKGFSGGGTKGAGYRTEYVHGENKNKELPAQYFNDSGGASRFFYVAKASKRERNAGLEGMPERETKSLQDNGGEFKTGSGNERNNKSQNHHPTVKPIKLMEYLCRLITPPGGVILDPFMGSGSTGVAAKRLGFEFIGIEMNEEYVEIARRRIA